eukprot:TRINITY_DN48916_c0_g1_i1.p1 TRINITY_DN48916_c0_g1~~TRINITY_DN48916_c0_g1_i1.p1  ORF type:complete len:296 (+),score=74.98 TRINITY_DN48916_c0_g1_i1:104-991(+)
MDSLSADPVLYSSLEADEFDDHSGEENEELGDDDAEEEEEVEDEEPDLKDKIVLPRFEAWLGSKKLPEGETRELIAELYSRLEVLEHGVDMISCIRCLDLRFSISGMQGIYQQQSLADPDSPAWELSSDGQQLQQVPNLTVKWVLDDEVLIDCQHFVGSGNAASSSSVDKERISDRFGSDTLEQLGGIEVLLQFLGTICADCDAPPAYAQHLPFGGISEAIVHRAIVNTGGQSPSKVRKKPAKKAAGGSAAGISYKPPLRSVPKAAVPRPPDDTNKGAVPRPKPKSRSSSASRKP